VAQITVDELRAEIGMKLVEARNAVRRYEEQLGTIDSLLRERGETVTTPPAPSSRPKLILRKRGSDKTAGGEAIRQAMLKADGPFNVPGIVAIVQPQFPDITYEKLSRRASAVAYRLWKKTKKIELVEAGAGRSPNTYKRVGK
jgi:hypothetical protein